MYIYFIAFSKTNYKESAKISKFKIFSAVGPLGHI